MQTLAQLINNFLAPFGLNVFANLFCDFFKKNDFQSGVTVLDGEHFAQGKGKIIGIHTRKPTFFKPGTKSFAEGEGEITATKIGD